MGSLVVIKEFMKGWMFWVYCKKKYGLWMFWFEGFFVGSVIKFKYFIGFLVDIGWIFLYVKYLGDFL